MQEQLFLLPIVCNFILSSCCADILCSTIWENGSLRPIPRNQLQERVEIARKQIVTVLGSLGSFKDKIILGAKAPLPRTFERATATAKRIEVNSIEGINLEELLEEGATQLAAVYQMQSIGGT